MSATLRVLVAGGGVTGSAIALRLAQSGVGVVLADPSLLGDNASGVAAGMIAPAFEAVLDDVSRGHFDLFRAGRDLWPDLLGRMRGGDVGFRRSGAIWVDLADDEPERSPALTQRLKDIGAAVEALGPVQARSLAPGLAADIRRALFVGDDWRVDPVPALLAMQDAAARAGCERIAAKVLRFEQGVATLSDGARIVVDHLVVATGADDRSLAPELSRLSPIKGQILRFPGSGPLDGPAIRSRGGYAVPSAFGLTVGATMEVGKTDREVNPATTDELSAVAASLFPALATRQPTTAAGVRASTSDGLPLVGRSANVGVLLAAGMRRNGWLLAPLVAEVVAACIVGADQGPYADRLRASRFETT